MPKCNQMKKLLFSIFSGLWLLLSGCASVYEAPKTITSDLFPKSIDRANYYYELAQGFSNDSQYDKAIDYGRLAISHNSQNAQYGLQLISDLQKLGKQNQTTQELKLLNQMAQQDPLVASQLFSIYINQKKTEEAKALYQIWSSKDSQNPKWLWGLYAVAKMNQHLPQQLTIASRLSELDPQNTLVWSELAKIYYELNDPINEKKYLLKSYDLDRNQADIVLRLSQLSYQSAQIEIASQYLQQFTLTNPFNGLISTAYSTVLVHQKVYDLAEKEYNKQLFYAEDASLILLKKAHLNYLRKDFKLAYEQYNKLLKTNPSDEGFYYQGLTCKQLQDNICALDSWGQVVADSDYFPEARIRMINLENNLRKAILLSEQSFLVRKDSTELLKIYTQLLLKNNEVRKSEEVLLQAGKSHLKNPDIILLHAYVKHRLGDTPTFRRLINAVLKMSPDNSKIYASLAKLWFDNNESAADTEFFARTAWQFGDRNIETKMILAWSLYKQQKISQALPVFEEFYEQSQLKVQPADDLASIYKWASVFLRSSEFASYATQDSNKNLRYESSELPLDSKIQRLPASFLSPNLSH